MNKKFFLMTITLLLLGSVCTFCITVPNTIVGKRNPTDKSWTGMVMNGNPGCSLPPSSFKESDLIGTWIGKPGTATFTTLTIYDDHTYKQIYKDPYINLVYESEGKPKWRLEYRKSGIHLLHLEKMKDCDNNLSSCEKKYKNEVCSGLMGGSLRGRINRAK